MRRLVALIPAVLLVLTLAPSPAVQAEVPHNIYLPCKTEPFPRSSVQVNLWWYASGLVTGTQRDTELLAHIAITDTCRWHWAVLTFSENGTPSYPYMRIAIAPGRPEQSASRA